MSSFSLNKNQIAERKENNHSLVKIRKNIFVCDIIVLVAMKLINDWGHPARDQIWTCNLNTKQYPRYNFHLKLTVTLVPGVKIITRPYAFIFFGVGSLLRAQHKPITPRGVKKNERECITPPAWVNKSASTYINIDWSRNIVSKQIQSPRIWGSRRPK